MSGSKSKSKSRAVSAKARKTGKARVTPGKLSKGGKARITRKKPASRIRTGARARSFAHFKRDPKMAKSRARVRARAGKSSKSQLSRLSMKSKRKLFKKPKLMPKSSKTLKMKLKTNAKLKMKLKKSAGSKAKPRKAPAKTSVIEAKAVQPQKKALSRELQDVLAKAEARHWIIELGGENAIDVIRGLPLIPNDEELAKKLKIKVSDVRASLNKMHNEGLVTYVRDKNSETGWYSYAWVINEDRIKKWVCEHYSMQDSCAPKEGTAFYFCKNCGLESVLAFADASDCAFRCQSCNTSLDFLDDDKFSQLRKPKMP